MTITGMLRVRNEARWISRVIGSMRPICDRIIAMDDHSDDGTADLLAAAGVEVLPSPFSGLDETRDKNWLLDQIGATDWILAIDGDELLTNAPAVRALMDMPIACLTFPILYLWDREDQVRNDGVYGRFRRHSAFRPNGARFTSPHGGGFHCGNVPASLRVDAVLADAPLVHFGYVNRDDRLRKYAWYNACDPNNRGEDCYRHIVQGDIPEVPATARLMHGGPLSLAPLEVA